MCVVPFEPEGVLTCGFFLVFADVEVVRTCFGLVEELLEGWSIMALCTESALALAGLQVPVASLRQRTVVAVRLLPAWLLQITGGDVVIILAMYVAAPYPAVAIAYLFVLPVHEQVETPAPPSSSACLDLNYDHQHHEFKVR